MAAVNSQPLQTRPFDENVAAAAVAVSAFQMEDDDGEFVYGGDEAMAEEGEEEEEEEEGGGGEVHHASSAAAAAAARGGVGAVTAAAASSGMRTSELTLSFEGEVYVFPAVTAQKVQAMLLLLGGRDVPTSSSPAFEMSYNHNIRGMGDIPKRSNLSRRIASLVRFREKRKERCFDKKIRYTVRKEVAQRMHRKNGQFASLKENSGGSGWESAQSSLQDGTPQPETVLRRCQHCGVSESNTPAMRRGPAGPRTLCNACGLMWANKGTLRDLSKGGRNLSIEHIEPGTPLEMKPSVVKSAFSGNQNGHGASEDPSKLVIEGPKDASVNRNMEICLHDLHEAAEDIMNTMPMGIISSTNDDDQETLLELTNTSDIDLDIPTNFD